MAKKKEEVLIAYKAFDKDLKCRGFQFEIGKTFEHKGKVEICESGFHACENPLDMLNYYDLTESRFALVEMSGDFSRKNDGDTKVAAGRINIKAELKFPDVISAAFNWIYAACTAGNVPASGDYSQLAASGDSSKLAASGHYSQLAASGPYSQLAASGYSSKLAASGYFSKLAASGYFSKLAASGHYSQLAASGPYSQLAASGYSSKLAASGANSIVCASATDCTASVGDNGCIVLTRWVESEKRYRVSVGYVGENGIKANTLYRLNNDGEFVEVV